MFLTGHKRVGKSTVLKKLLANHPEVAGGFRTLRVPCEGGCSVHMLSPEETECTAENQIFRKHSGRLYLDIGDFDRIGCDLLKKSEGCPLILMDELGPTEADALSFRGAVWKTLDDAERVYGVLQMAESDFLEQVAARADVQVVTVTEGNRDDLPRLLAEQGW